MPSFFSASDRAALAARVARLGPDSLPLWGRMTARQMVCHLADSFRAPLGDRPIEPSGRLLHRTLVRWMAFSTPLPWPKGAPTLRELDQRGGGTPSVGLESDREALLALMERFAALGDALDGVHHPIFGRLSRREWDRWAWRHTDHHLRQFGK